MVDLVFLVAGVAFSFAVVTNLSGPPIVRSPLDQLIHAMFTWLHGMALAISFVALARVGIFRRMPTAAEWLGILVGITLLADWSYLRIDAYIYAYRWAFPSLDRFSYTGVRWVIASLVTVVMAISLFVFRLGWHDSPTWLKSILLTWLALLAMTGPLWAFCQDGADLISPSEGFGPGDWSILHREACLLAAALPMGILFGLPIIATLTERLGGRRWTWNEWAAVSASATLGIVSIMTYRGEFRTPSVAWLVERLMVAVWIVVIALASRWILSRFGPAWRRWVEGPDDQDRSSLSGSDSAESHL